MGAAEQDAGERQTGAAVQQRVEQLLASIQPNKQSEFRRLTIASYVINLIKGVFRTGQVEAFMFGSVPLRTYLPDGDIDISVFGSRGPTGNNGSDSGGSSHTNLRETWASQLLKALEAEQARSDAPFRIRDLHIIQAEVKLVKCVVADLVVDVSFETLGGLCTVAFLEAIDRKIGRSHLFKRSIVLVKAWCYYESRLLGAHHGLISSYALETMVLYVFNLHHKELNSPMEVLGKFLEVFSSFNWDEYCLSLQGPIPLNTFPNPEVDLHGLDPGSQLLDPPFLDDVLSKYSVQQQQQQQQQSGAGAAPPTPQHFVLKHLNIVDPLLPPNNLGRSVSKASFARIRRAFAHGANALATIMAKDPLNALEGIDLFFRNTWKSPMRMAADNQAFMQRLGLGSVPFHIPLAPAYSAPPLHGAELAGLAAASQPPPPPPLAPAAPQQQQQHPGQQQQQQQHPGQQQQLQQVPQHPHPQQQPQPQLPGTRAAHLSMSQPASAASHAAAQLQAQPNYMQMLSDAMRQHQHQRFQQQQQQQPQPRGQFGGQLPPSTSNGATMGRTSLEALAQSLQLLQMQQTELGGHSNSLQYVAPLGRPPTAPPSVLLHHPQQYHQGPRDGRSVERRHSFGSLAQIGGGRSGTVTHALTSPIAAASIVRGSYGPQQQVVMDAQLPQQLVGQLPRGMPAPAARAQDGASARGEEGKPAQPSYPTAPQGSAAGLSSDAPAAVASAPSLPRSLPALPAHHQQQQQQQQPQGGAAGPSSAGPGSHAGGASSSQTDQQQQDGSAAAPVECVSPPAVSLPPRHPLAMPGAALPGSPPPPSRPVHRRSHSGGISAGVPVSEEALAVLLASSQLYATTAPNTPTTPAATAAAAMPTQAVGAAPPRPPPATVHAHFPPSNGSLGGSHTAPAQAGNVMATLGMLTPYQLQQLLAAQPQLLQGLISASATAAPVDAARTGLSYWIAPQQAASIPNRQPGTPQVAQVPAEPPRPQQQPVRQQQAAPEQQVAQQLAQHQSQEQPVAAPDPALEAQQPLAMQEGPRSLVLSPAQSGDASTASQPGDIFTGDLQSLSENLSTARSCQLQEKAPAAAQATAGDLVAQEPAAQQLVAEEPEGPSQHAAGDEPQTPCPGLPDSKADDEAGLGTATDTAPSLVSSPSPAADKVEAACASLPQLRTSSNGSAAAAAAKAAAAAAVRPPARTAATESSRSPPTTPTQPRRELQAGERGAGGSRQPLQAPGSAGLPAGSSAASTPTASGASTPAAAPPAGRRSWSDIARSKGSPAGATVNFARGSKQQKQAAAAAAAAAAAEQALRPPSQQPQPVQQAPQPQPQQQQHQQQQQQQQQQRGSGEHPRGRSPNGTMHERLAARVGAAGGAASRGASSAGSRAPSEVGSGGGTPRATQPASGRRQLGKQGRQPSNFSLADDDAFPSLAGGGGGGGGSPGRPAGATTVTGGAWGARREQQDL
ncbi:hypothetical protein N2152v2_001877 [Parachlorella kessleri]